MRFSNDELRVQFPPLNCLTIQIPLHGLLGTSTRHIPISTWLIYKDCFGSSIFTLLSLRIWSQDLRYEFTQINMYGRKWKIKGSLAEIMRWALIKITLIMSNLVVLFKGVLCLIKSINQFFLFGKPKSCGAFVIGFWESGGALRSPHGMLFEADLCSPKFKRLI